MRVACLMMQKNETELLDKWVIYHGSMFGFENLYIFDNGSTEPLTLNKIEKLSKDKVNFFLQHNTPSDFENKGEIIGSKILELESQYDFLIPLDCDEFIGLLNDNSEFSCSKIDILKELNNNIRKDEVLLFKRQYFNSPFDKEWFAPVENRKCFFRSGTFGSLDIGFHWGKSRLCSGEHYTNLIHFHFHNKPYETIKKHAKEKLKSRVASFDENYLKNYSENGAHLAEYLLQTEQEFLEKLTKIRYKKTSQLNEKFIQLNIAWPYEGELQKANSIIGITNKHLEETLKKENLKTLFPHYEVSGHIDNIYIDGFYIKISGWGIDDYGESISNFFALINNKIIKIKPDEITVINRHDLLNKINNNTNIACGFILSLSINNILILPKLDHFLIYGALKNSNNIVHPLRLGQKAQEFINNFNKLKNIRLSLKS